MLQKRFRERMRQSTLLRKITFSVSSKFTLRRTGAIQRVLWNSGTLAYESNQRFGSARHCV